MKKFYCISLALLFVFNYACNRSGNKNSETAENEEIAEIELSFVVVPPDDSFVISFPGQPDFSSEPVETEAGLVENNMYIYEYNGSLAYMVAYTDYPPENIQNYDPYELLNNAMNGFVGEIGISVNDSEKINFQKHPGIEFTASGQGYWAHMRDYLIGHRLFQIGLLSTEKIVNKADALAFFESFNLK